MCFGGPSGAEKKLEKQETAFSTLLMQDYSTTFGEQQDILKSLNSVLSPIVEAGPNQQGYSAAELSALNTQAIDSNARGYNDATKAAASRENAAGGGTSLLPSGVNSQINAEIGNEAEENLSNEQLGITEANYAQGRQNWETALSGELGVSGQESPLGYAGAGTNANSTAFGEAKTIVDQSQAQFANIIGGIEGIGAAAIGGVGNLDTTGGSSGGEQFMNFLAGI